MIKITDTNSDTFFIYIVKGDYRFFIDKIKCFDKIDGHRK